MTCDSLHANPIVCRKILLPKSQIHVVKGVPSILRSQGYASVAYSECQDDFLHCFTKSVIPSSTFVSETLVDLCRYLFFHVFNPFYVKKLQLSWSHRNLFNKKPEVEGFSGGCRLFPRLLKIFIKSSRPIVFEPNMATRAKVC